MKKIVEIEAELKFKEKRISYFEEHKAILKKDDLLFEDMDTVDSLNPSNNYNYFVDELGIIPLGYLLNNEV